jgi:hypothetical protein
MAQNESLDDDLYTKLYNKVEKLREAGFEPDRIVVDGEDWRGIKNQSEVLEGKGAAGGDKTLLNGVRVTYRENQPKARVIHEVEK